MKHRVCLWGRIRFQFEGRPIHETDTLAQPEAEDAGMTDGFQWQTGSVPKQRAYYSTPEFCYRSWMHSQLESCSLISDPLLDVKQLVNCEIPNWGFLFWLTSNGAGLGRPCSVKYPSPLVTCSLGSYLYSPVSLFFCHCFSWSTQHHKAPCILCLIGEFLCFLFICVKPRMSL